jgi:IS30 family transposase
LEGLIAERPKLAQNINEKGAWEGDALEEKEKMDKCMAWVTEPERL